MVTFPPRSIMSDLVRRKPDPAARARSSAEDYEAAVIDVGSNSVRLVAYRVQGRAMTPFVNEKVMAALGRDMGTSGRLRPAGVEAALTAVKRFRALVDGLGISQVDAVATAAVRVASDGAELVTRVRDEAGIALRVLTGAEEAQYSALGVMAGAGAISGVVGDLGGSSLELVEVGADGPGRGETYQLGPLSLMAPGAFDAGQLSNHMAATMASSQVLSGPMRGGTFFAVGGAWRALGRIDIALRRHPIGVLHHYVMDRAEALKVCAFVAKQSRRSLELLEEAAAKRADTLPYAAVALEQVLRLGGFERVVLSSYGLREGLLYAGLTPAVRATDALVSSAEAIATIGGAGRPGFGPALEAWLAPVFATAPPAFSPERDAVLRAAAARLADIGAMLHPEQRGEIMFDLVVRAPLAGLNHAERAYLAGAVHHRYTKSAPKSEAFGERLLTEDQRRSAAALGLAMRLGADVSGRAVPLLDRFRLRRAGGALVLSAAPGGGELLTEQAVKRLEPLAQALGLVARVEQG